MPNNRILKGKMLESRELFQLRESEASSYYIDFGIKNDDVGYKQLFVVE